MSVADDARVGRRDVVGADFGVLISVADVVEDGAAVAPSADDVLHVEVVVGVGCLEPGAAVVEIEVDGIGRRQGVIDAVEDILLVALVVEDSELGRIEKAAGVEAVGFDEVAPLLSAIGEVESAGGRAEGAIGGADASGGLCDSLARARGGDDDEAGFVAVLGRGRAGDDLDGLNGVGGNLVGEDLALLVGDGLAVDGEGVGGVIAEAVKEAVGVGCDAGGGFGHQRAEGGRLALHGNLGEQVAVDVGVEGGVGFDQVAGGLDGDCLGGAFNLEDELEIDADSGLDSDALDEGSEAGGDDVDAVVVEGNVGKIELAECIGGCGSVESADLIGEVNRGAGDDGAGRIGDRAANGAGVAALRGQGERR